MHQTGPFVPRNYDVFVGLDVDKLSTDLCRHNSVDNWRRLDGVRR